MKIWQALAAVAGTYLVDVPVRRAVAARNARACANARGLPMLNVGAGTGSSALFGSTHADEAGRDARRDSDGPTRIREAMK